MSCTRGRTRAVVPNDIPTGARLRDRGLTLHPFEEVKVLPNLKLYGIIARIFR